MDTQAMRDVVLQRVRQHTVAAADAHHYEVGREFRFDYPGGSVQWRVIGKEYIHVVGRWDIMGEVVESTDTREAK